jgi:hypothetical protein
VYEGPDCHPLVPLNNVSRIIIIPFGPPRGIPVSTRFLKAVGACIMRSDRREVIHIHKFPSRAG